MSYKIMSEIQIYVDSGSIKKTIHGDMVMFTYSRKCMIEGLWHLYTKRCRGIIFDIAGNVVCRPLDKFFNLGEVKDTHPAKIDYRLRNHQWVATNKMDGSLINIFHHNGKWRTTTKGGFTSTQAIVAGDLLGSYDFDKLPKNLTYCCELITPWDRKVVDYGDDTRLVLLAALTNEWEPKELSRKELEEVSMISGIELVETINLDPMAQDLRDVIVDGDEGYVVSFDDGFRVKVKSHWYFTCHKLLQSVNKKAILELAKNATYKSFAERLPNHIQPESDDIYAWIMTEYEKLKLLPKTYEASLWELPTIKEKALWIKDWFSPDEQPIMFAYINGKDINPVIWRCLARRIKDEANTEDIGNH